MIEKSFLWSQRSLKMTSSVKEVLTSSFLTQGPIVPKFEQEVSSKVKAQFGIAVNSATSALHIACLALGLDQVIVYGHHRLHSWHQPTADDTAEQKSTLLISIARPADEHRHSPSQESAPNSAEGCGSGAFRVAVVTWRRSRNGRTLWVCGS